MKTKLFRLVFSTLVLAFLVLGIASAAQFSLSSSSLSLSKGTNSTYFTITNLNSTSSIQVNVPSFANINDSSSHSLSLSTQPTGLITIANGSSQRINVSYSNSASNFNYGTFSSSINVSTGSESQIVTLIFNSLYCSAGEKNTGLLDIDVDYDVKKGFGEDDEWYPNDEIEVTVNVDNTGNDDLEDLVLSWCLYDNKENKCVLDGEEDSFDLDEGDDTDIVFTIDVDPDEINEDNENYQLLIKVFGDNSDFREKDLCVENGGDSIRVIIEKDLVVLSKIEVPDSVPCGQFVDISGKAWNIGTKDQEDVYATIYNKDLGIINQRIDFGDIDSFESKTFNIQIKVPLNASAKTYPLYFSVYDEDDDVYESDDEASFSTVSLKVENCQPIASPVSITAELNEDTPRAIIGSQVVVTATLKNTGTSQATYSVGISGNTQWSSLAQIDPTSVNLNAGESKKVNIYLDINKDASEGSKDFTIKVSSNGATSSEQKVSLALENSFSRNALMNNIRENWLVYTIVLVNILLIIAIIAVVVRIVRKSED